MIKVEAIPTPSRREFCASCGRAAGLLALGAAAGCGGNSSTGPSSGGQALPSAAATVSGRTVSIQAGAGTTLASTGAMAVAQTSIGSFLVTRTGSTTATALTAVCTHEGCAITDFSGSQFVCPCHGSTFTSSGAVVKGPANRSLQSFNTQVNGDVITFTA
jgi:nitrite reductase/ring-hydroxylating ferredoxin subunit